jgi:hypothetical protein
MRNTSKTHTLTKAWFCLHSIERFTARLFSMLLVFFYEIHLKYCQDTDVYIDKSTIYFSNMENNLAVKRSMECKQNQAFVSVCVFEKGVIYVPRERFILVSIPAESGWRPEIFPLGV